MRWSRTVLAVLLLSGGAAAAAPGDGWRVSGASVHLRRAPAVASAIKRQLPEGQTLIERGRDGDWYHVEVFGEPTLQGWVHRTFLSPVPNEPAPPPAAGAAAGAPPLAGPAASPAEKLLLDQMRAYVTGRDRLPKAPKPAGQRGRVIIGPMKKPANQSSLPAALVLAASPAAAGISPEAVETFRASVSYLNLRAWSVARMRLFSGIQPVGAGGVRVRTTEDWSDVPSIGQRSYLNTLLDRWASAKADGGPASVMLVDQDGDVLMHQARP